MKKLLLSFVIRFIKKNMSHEDVPTRNAIFKAISSGMSERFFEDNCPTRIYYMIRWLFENDEEYNALVKSKGDNFKQTIAKNISNAILVNQ